MEQVFLRAAFPLIPDLRTDKTAPLPQGENHLISRLRVADGVILSVIEYPPELFFVAVYP